MVTRLRRQRGCASPIGQHQHGDLLVDELVHRICHAAAAGADFGLRREGPLNVVERREEGLGLIRDLSDAHIVALANDAATPGPAWRPDGRVTPLSGSVPQAHARAPEVREAPAAR